MFTSVCDPGHQRAQSYNYALWGLNHSNYSTGPGKVIKRRRVLLSWEPDGYDLETPFKKEIAFLAILALWGSPTKPNIRRCKWPDSGEACLALASSSDGRFRQLCIFFLMFYIGIPLMNFKCGAFGYLNGLFTTFFSLGVVSPTCH